MSKIKSLADLQARQIFTDGIDEKFVAALGNYMEHANNENVAVVLRGLSIDEQGNLTQDECFANGQMVPMISKLSKRVSTGNDDDGKPTFEQQIKAIVVSPVPTLDSLLAHEKGREWLDTKLSTELSHITMRNLRDADDVTDEKVIEAMPIDIDSFITARRSGGKADNEAFNELWKPVLDALKRHEAIGSLLQTANLKKSIFEKALSNAAYATAMYANLENANIFELALKIIIKEADSNGFDSAIVKNWLETRQDQSYEVKAFDLDSIDLGDIDLDDDEDETAES